MMNNIKKHICIKNFLLISYLYFTSSKPLLYPAIHQYKVHIENPDTGAILPLQLALKWFFCDIAKNEIFNCPRELIIYTSSDEFLITIKWLENGIRSDFPDGHKPDLEMRLGNDDGSDEEVIMKSTISNDLKSQLDLILYLHSQNKISLSLTVFVAKWSKTVIINKDKKEPKIMTQYFNGKISVKNFIGMLILKFTENVLFKPDSMFCSNEFIAHSENTKKWLTMANEKCSKYIKNGIESVLGIEGGIEKMEIKYDNIITKRRAYIFFKVVPDIPTDIILKIANNSFSDLAGNLNNQMYKWKFYYRPIIGIPTYWRSRRINKIFIYKIKENEELSVIYSQISKRLSDVFLVQTLGVVLMTLILGTIFALIPFYIKRQRGKYIKVLLKENSYIEMKTFYRSNSKN